MKKINKKNEINDKQEVVLNQNKSESEAKSSYESIIDLANELAASTRFEIANIIRRKYELEGLTLTASLLKKEISSFTDFLFKEIKEDWP